MATIEARSEGPRGPSETSELAHMAEKQSLLERIPLVEDLQAAWLLFDVLRGHEGQLLVAHRPARVHGKSRRDA